MDGKSAVAPCAHCRTGVQVPDSYAHGDHIRCGVCGTSSRVQRGEQLRLVLADPTPLKDALRDAEQRLERLEDELTGARGRLGVGAHGLSFGVVYLLYATLLERTTISITLLLKAFGIVVFFAVALEAFNYFFFAKRQRIERISEEIGEIQSEVVELRHKLREAIRR